MSSRSRHDLSRRQVLERGLAFAAGVATLGPRSVLGEAEDDATRWAFVSDTHIPCDPDRRCRGSYPYHNLCEIVAHVQASFADGLVITGDLARRRGRIEAYENLKVVLTPLARERPVYLGIGNHDDRRVFFRTFGGTTSVKHPVENRHILTVTIGPVRLVVLDTLYVVNMMPGLLGRPQLSWLDRLLRACDDRPTILCLHHTPKVELLDTGRFFEIIAPVTKVKAVVYGHSHKYAYSQYKGIHLINLPAAGYNFSSKQPIGWVEAHLTARAGCFTLHAIAGNRTRAEKTERLCWRV